MLLLGNVPAGLTSFSECWHDESKQLSKLLVENTLNAIVTYLDYHPGYRSGQSKACLNREFFVFF